MGCNGAMDRLLEVCEARGKTNDKRPTTLAKMMVSFENGSDFGPKNGEKLRFPKIEPLGLII
jgi:hypothetical protein